MQGVLFQMRKLFGIARHIDRGDPATVDLKGRGLQPTAFLDTDKARQPVDETVMQQPGHMCGEDRCQRRKELRHLVTTDNRLSWRHCLATTVRIDGCIIRKQRLQLFDIAAS